MRDALISCHTNNQVAHGFLVATLAQECVKQICPWYARVPTDSNLSDGPSRLETERVLQLGACCDTIDFEDYWAQHLVLSAKSGEHQAQCCVHRSK